MPRAWSQDEFSELPDIVDFGRIPSNIALGALVMVVPDTNDPFGEFDTYNELDSFAGIDLDSVPALGPAQPHSPPTPPPSMPEVPAEQAVAPTQVASQPSTQYSFTSLSGSIWLELDRREKSCGGSQTYSVACPNEPTRALNVNATGRARAEPHSCIPCGHSYCGACILNWIEHFVRPTHARFSQGTHLPGCVATLLKGTLIAPNFSFRNVIESHISALSDAGKAEWNPETGAEYQRWSDRKTEWSTHKAVLTRFRGIRRSLTLDLQPSPSPLSSLSLEEGY
ncbi:uncharacterized protein BXZ73DRAFT_104259 [Epithele typhae]|uniref:uncharacterized protein n=1 Tax=Epithele typhae TaxID=378194 RepID=UPI0020086B8D|nr:uncharacterized protein BXZ73DRAFT_104259 [Epithele typhae]KAH9922001.1 hypothetical protein BXZ73DRAFT_104259 [Epithele typhae]